MIYKRLFAYFILFIFLFISFAIANENYVIGYGSSNAIIPVKNQEYCFMGFKLGLYNILKKNYVNLLAIDQESDRDPFGAIKSAKNLLNMGVDILVGFPSSDEALLAAEVAKKNNILALFADASHEKLGQMGPNIYTTGESMESSVKSMLKLIKFYFKNKQGVWISNIKSVFSMSQDNMIHQLLKQKNFKDLKIKPLYLNLKLKLHKKDLEYLKNKSIQYIYLTCYADKAVNLMRQLKNNNINLSIIANSSWTTGDIELIRRYLDIKKKPIYGTALWLHKNKHLIKFKKLIKKTYGINARPEMAIGYDLGVITATVLNRIKGEPTKEKIKKAFQQNTCFHNTSSGTICFGSNGGFAKRKLYYVKFTKDGFIPLNKLSKQNN